MLIGQNPTQANQHRRSKCPSPCSNSNSRGPLAFSPNCSTLQSVRNCYLRCHSARRSRRNRSGHGNRGRRGGPEVTLAPPHSVRRSGFLATLGRPSGPLLKPDRLGTAQDHGGGRFIPKQTSGCRSGTVFHREVTVEPAGDCQPGPGIWLPLPPRGSTGCVRAVRYLAHSDGRCCSNSIGGSCDDMADVENGAHEGPADSHG